MPCSTAEHRTSRQKTRRVRNTIRNGLWVGAVRVAPTVAARAATGTTCATRPSQCKQRLPAPSPRRLTIHMQHLKMAHQVPLNKSNVVANLTFAARHGLCIATASTSHKPVVHKKIASCRHNPQFL
ncbi:hypothetical protein LY78DRAFT_277194 [Colletotrichum sublineola]|nr:hypothetical protein LY78DRAFT_277194 [Colletotrichum sublineola]